MWKVNPKIFVVFCLFTMALIESAGAVMHYVNPSMNIQAAIDASSNGDEIEVLPGIYNEAIDFKGKSVRLYSSGGPDVTTIDGNGAYHVVKCVSGEDSDSILEGFTITGGKANGAWPDNSGGGIYNERSSPTVNDCNFNGNTAEFGGGMYCSGSSPTLTNCKFSGNSAGRYGGGMYCVSDSNPTLTNCTFSGNDAITGGGTYCSYRNPTLTNCTFSGNSAGYYGSGIYSEFANPILTDSFLCGNFISDTLALSQIEGSFTDNGNNFINDACPPPVAKIEGDLDGDGVVEFGDVAILCNNWLAGLE